MVMTIKKGTNKAGIEQLIKKLKAAKKSSGVDAYKFCGVIKLKNTPEQIQNQLRSEWD